MRQLTTLCRSLFCLTIVLSALAAAQVVTSGYVTDWTPPPGMYAAPFAPLVTTPTVNLPTPSLQVGASNATAANATGATSTTASRNNSGPEAAFERPAWYGQTPLLEPAEEASTEAGTTTAGQRFELGAARFQAGYGVAQLAAEQGLHGRAQRIYTNDDIVRLDQQNGMVKAGEKTERIE